MIACNIEDARLLHRRPSMLDADRLSSCPAITIKVQRAPLRSGSASQEQAIRHCMDRSRAPCVLQGCGYNHNHSRSSDCSMMVPGLWGIRRSPWRRLAPSRSETSRISAEEPGGPAETRRSHSRGSVTWTSTAQQVLNLPRSRLLYVGVWRPQDSITKVCERPS